MFMNWVAAASVALPIFISTESGASPDFEVRCGEATQCDVIPICRQPDLSRKPTEKREAEGRENYVPRRPPPVRDGGPPKLEESELMSAAAIAARQRLSCEAIKGGDALHKFAIMVQYGMGGLRNEAAARLLYRKANTRTSQWYLGMMLENGEGGLVDLPEARRLYEQSSQGGQIDARYHLARMMRAGLGGPVDAVKARELLTEVEPFCHGSGSGDLAEMAERGEGGPVDLDLAAKQYIKAEGCYNPYFKEPALTFRPETISVAVRKKILIVRVKMISKAMNEQIKWEDEPSDGETPKPGK